MTTLEDLLQAERQAVDPSPHQVARVQRRLRAAVGVSAGLATTTVATSAAAQGGLLSKWTALLANKAVWLWGVGTMASVGLGYTIAQETAPETPVPHTAAPVAPPAAPPPVEQTERQAQPELEPSPALKTHRAEPRTAEIQTRQAPPASPRKVARVAPRDRLKEDARRLTEISGALNQGRAARALELLGGVDVNSSPLASEFRAARAIALCQTGRRAIARKTIATLEKSAPQSPTLVRVREACGLNR